MLRTWFRGGLGVLGVVWGVSTDPDRSYHFTKIVYNLPFIGFLYLLYRVIPHCKWRHAGFVFHNTPTRYFRTIIIMITSHQGYMSVPVA